MTIIAVAVDPDNICLSIDSVNSFADVFSRLKKLGHLVNAVNKYE